MKLGITKIVCFVRKLRATLTKIKSNEVQLHLLPSKVKLIESDSSQREIN